MSITLSNTELEQLRRGIEVLVSPLDYAHVDQWRSAAIRHLRELLRADSAGFLLPVSEGLLMYSEKHDHRELAAYPDAVAPDMGDGTPMWAQMVKAEVDTLANMYGRHYDRYLGSAYYNEYAGANGAHDPLLATTSVGGSDARSIASLHFWHARPDGRLFGEREVTLLRLLFPAFRAGVESQLRWGQQRQDLLQALDSLGQPALLCDPCGRPLHLTPCLEALLAAEPEAEMLRGEMMGVVAVLRHRASGDRARGVAPLHAPDREVRTGRARYRVSGCVYGGPPAGERAVVLVGVTCLTPTRRSEEEIREKWLLTRAEARVAMQLAEGRSNEEIARELYLSPHTVRRHTEKVLQKMNLRSRAEVAAHLHG